MANTITGKVIAISDIQTIASKTPGKEPMLKRSLYMDCTRFDPYTGVRDQYENTPLLEFGGKALETLNALVAQGLKAGDVVTVSFDIQGSKYEKDGKTQIFTRVRPYNIEVRSGQQQQPQQPAAAPAPQAPAPAAPAGPADDLPFDF